MQLPVVTMVTDSHGACVVQPMSAGLGVLTVHGGGSEAAFLFFHLFGESPAFISCPAEKVLM